MDSEQSSPEPVDPQPAAPRPSVAKYWLAWLAATLVGPAVLPALVQDHARQDSIIGMELILLFCAQLLTSMLLAKRLKLRQDGTQGSFGCLTLVLIIGSWAVGLAIYVISCASVHPVTFR